jgi:hypothetical protein
LLCSELLTQNEEGWHSVTRIGWVFVFLFLMTTSSGFFKKFRNQGTKSGIWWNSKSNNHWIWLFQNPSKNCFLGNYLTFSKLLRTVVICPNWVFGFSENRDLWTLRATLIHGKVSNTHPTSSVTLKNLKRSEFSMFFSWKVVAKYS